ncbi:DnaJ domain-containing protein [Microvirga sp. W0021]|uniref:DnaJ domain-containing protein n=1 Tax=Hohaiivirga grylli TaxID=3133970 RepID=A0ABV0BMS9_9HYPH
MNLNSPLFDRIRIKSGSAKTARKDSEPNCEHPGCSQPGLYRAPKGRGNEGKYWRFCMDHVREYNATYNYFDGMTDDAVQAYQKNSVIGHRPTWSMGVRKNQKPEGPNGEQIARDWEYFDPLGVLRGENFNTAQPKKPAEPKKKRLTAPVRKALDVMGLDSTADAAAIKAQYKQLVKRFHPDANGGDRSFEERLRDIIRAHDILKTAGMC